MVAFLLILFGALGIGAIFSPAMRAIGLIFFVMFLCWLVQ